MENKTQDAAGRALVGAAGASNSDVLADEDDDAEQGVITSGYGPGADEFSPRSVTSDRFRGPTDVTESQ